MLDKEWKKGVSVGPYSGELYADVKVGPEFKFQASTGSVDLDYDININAAFPDTVNVGQTFTIDTSSYVVSDPTLALTGTGVTGNATFYLEGGFGIRNQELFGRSLGNITSSENMTKNLLPLDIDGPAGSSIEVNLPAPPTATQTGTSTTSRMNTLQVRDTSNFFNISGDLDALLQKAFWPALPDILELPERTYSVLGQDFTLGGSVLDLGATAGIDFGQQISFTPTGVDVDMVSSTGERRSGKLGDSFSFTAPSSGEGEIEVEADCTLNGELRNETGFVGTLQFNLEILSAKLQHVRGEKDSEFTGTNNPDPDKTILSAKLLDRDFPVPPLSGDWFVYDDAFSLNSLATVQDTYFISYGQQGQRPDGPVISHRGSGTEPFNGTTVNVQLDLPAYQYDGDVDFSFNIGRTTNSNLYNFAYIIDVSGSMSGNPIRQAKDAYIAFTDELESLGIADNSRFALVPFSTFSSLRSPLTSSQIKAQVSGLSAGGSTYYEGALLKAIDFFNSAPGGTNIAYFLSDGIPGDRGRYSDEAARLKALADVRAYGTAGASLSTLNIIDSGNAQYIDLDNLLQGLSGAGVDRSDITRVDILVNNQVNQSISASQLQESTVGFTASGTISGLTPGIRADVTARVVFNNGASSSIGVTGVIDETINGQAGAGNDVVGLRRGQKDLDAGDGDDRVSGNFLRNTLQRGGGGRRTQGRRGRRPAGRAAGQ